MNLLLAAVLLLQDNTAEEAFKKIEEVIEKTKTLSMDVYLGQLGGINGGDEAPSITYATGSALFKEGNRALFRMTTIRGRQFSNWGIIVDGDSMFRAFKAEASPPKLSQVLKRSITRGGILETLKVSALRNMHSTRENQIEGMATPIEVSNFSSITDDDEKSARTFSYKSKAANTSDFKEVQVWYNPKDHHLVMVRITVGISPETYQKFLYNPDIPDEKFKIVEREK
jgi:hypothetical protein